MRGVFEEDELEDELRENSSGSTRREAQKRPILSWFSAGGAEGVEPLTSSLRTRSLVGAAELVGSERRNPFYRTTQSSK